MVLTAAQITFVRDHDVYAVVQAGIDNGFSQADITFALTIKQVQYLEGLWCKK